MYKFFFLIFFMFFISFQPFSQSSFDSGKELFRQNSVEEALYLFEEALITNPTQDVYKYLAESYSILEMYEDEVLVLEDALANNVEDQSYFYFKLGNAYYSTGNYKGALDSYLKVITLKKSFLSEAFLNVANVSVELKLYSSAIDNYTKYLELKPNSTQKRKIIKMIMLLKKAHRDDESRKLEEARLKAEEERLAEEQKLAEEMEQKAVEEEKARKIAENQRLEAERELKARELEEERLLFDQEQKALEEDQRQLAIDEEKVINPPDPDIEAQKRALQLREQELMEREQQVVENEKALREAEDDLAKNLKAIEEFNEPELSAEELKRVEEEKRERAELERLKLEEEARQQALMNDILESLDKIGENAKGISASSEGAFGELEGSDIDE